MERFDVLLQFILLLTFYGKRRDSGFCAVNVVEVGFGRERIGAYERQRVD